MYGPDKLSAAYHPAVEDVSSLLVRGQAARKAAQLCMLISVKDVWSFKLPKTFCCAVEDVSSLLVRGQAARKVGETAMNRESSRSHSVFTCTLECSSTDASGVTQILHSRLNLVDLAGEYYGLAS